MTISKDTLIRVLATFLQTVIGTVIAHAAGISTWWATAIAAGLAVLQQFVLSLTGLPNAFGSLTLATLERVGWTAAEAAIATVGVDSLGVPKAYLPVTATILTMLKVFLASKVGSDQSAATLPASADPAVPGDPLAAVRVGMPLQH